MTAMVSGRLNPNAALYVPVAYREVEDFSAEWWELVKSSSWFRDYWLSVCQVEEEEEVEDLETLFEEMVMLAEAEEKSVSDRSFGENDHVGETKSNGIKVDVKFMLKDIVAPKSPKQRSPKSPIGPAKFRKKTAPFVTPKITSPRIHQPR